MTQQLRKLYLFFETVSEFPIGLLLMQFSMYYTVMDSMCALSIHMKKCGTKLVETSKNAILFELIDRAEMWLQNNTYKNPIHKWETEIWGENPADFGRK